MLTSTTARTCTDCTVTTRAHHLQTSLAPGCRASMQSRGMAGPRRRLYSRRAMAGRPYTKVALPRSKVELVPKLMSDSFSICSFAPRVMIAGNETMHALGLGTKRGQASACFRSQACSGKRLLGIIISQRYYNGTHSVAQPLTNAI